MRKLQIDLYNCGDCPYFSCEEGTWNAQGEPNPQKMRCEHAEGYQEMGPKFNGGGIPAWCPLPVAEPDRSLLTCECCDPAQSREDCEQDDTPSKFNAFSVRFAEVEGIPDAWLQGLSPAERRNLKESDEERLERILKEEGIDVSETVAYDPFEDSLYGIK